MKIKNLKSFWHSYMEAAIWSSNTDDYEPEGYNITDESELAEQAQVEMLADCARFLADNWELIEEEPEPPTNSDDSSIYARAGHDFWLTRCGHGVGFWDGDWPVNGNKLANASKSYGYMDLYVGKDGLVYQDW